MVNEGNQIHNFISSYGNGTVISYGYGSDSTSKKVPVPTVPIPVPVPQHCFKKIISLVSWRSLTKREGSEAGSGSVCQRYGSVLKCHGSGTLSCSVQIVNWTSSSHRFRIWNTFKTFKVGLPGHILENTTIIQKMVSSLGRLTVPSVPY